MAAKKPDFVTQLLNGASAIRLGAGVIAKLVLLGVIALGVLAVCASRVTSDGVMIAIIGTVAIVTLSIIFGSFWFANRNPGAALLEGSNLILYNHIQSTAKDLPDALLTADPVPNPLVQIEEDKSQ